MDFSEYEKQEKARKARETARAERTIRVLRLSGKPIFDIRQGLTVEKLPTIAGLSSRLWKHKPLSATQFYQVLNAPFPS